MDGKIAIRAEGLRSGYGQSCILFGVDFEAKEGEITVIVGPNGGGKSTLLKSIFGMCTVHGGSVEYFGAPITKKPPHAISRMGIAYLPQVDNVFSDLTVRENFLMSGYSLDQKKIPKRMGEVIGSFPFLRGRLGSKAGSLSGGQRQMLAMAMALMRKPRIMLFDEPTANLSPKMAGEVVSKIAQLREEFATTVVLVEQNVRRALDLGDTAYLIANGKLGYSGPCKELASNPDLGRMYLGAD